MARRREITTSQTSGANYPLTTLQSSQKSNILVTDTPNDAFRGNSDLPRGNNDPQNDPARSNSDQPRGNIDAPPNDPSSEAPRRIPPPPPVPRTTQP